MLFFGNKFISILTKYPEGRLQTPILDVNITVWGEELEWKREYMYKEKSDPNSQPNLVPTWMVSHPLTRALFASHLALILNIATFQK